MTGTLVGLRPFGTPLAIGSGGKGKLCGLSSEKRPAGKAACDWLQSVTYAATWALTSKETAAAVMLTSTTLYFPENILPLAWCYFCPRCPFKHPLCDRLTDLVPVSNQLCHYQACLALPLPPSHPSLRFAAPAVRLSLPTPWTATAAPKRRCSSANPRAKMSSPSVRCESTRRVSLAQPRRRRLPLRSSPRPRLPKQWATPTNLSLIPMTVLERIQSLRDAHEAIV